MGVLYIVKFLKKLRNFFVISLILCIISLLIYDVKIVPLIEKYAISEAGTVLNNYINQTVYDFINENPEGFNNITAINYTENNKISAVNIDSAKVNVIKSYVNNEIQRYITEDNHINVSFPLGNALGSTYFAGVGPNINLNIKVNGSVVGDIKSEFYEAGINQTSHRVVLEIKNDIFIVMPFIRKNVKFNSNFSISETVIVGEVPDSYTVVNDNVGGNAAEYIADYGNGD